MMKQLISLMARAALALVWMLSFLTACQAAPALTQPDGGGEPQPMHATGTPLQTATKPVPTSTPQPSATPLRRLDAPIIWYLRGTAPDDLQQINEALNRALAERGFQARVEMRVIDPVAFEPHMAEIQTAGQPWDLVALSASSYPAWLEQDRLLPLTAYMNSTTNRVENLIDTRLPGLKASLPAGVWAGLLHAGDLSAIPNQDASASPRGFSIRADVAAALNLQADLEQVRTYADLSPLLEKIQAAIVDGALEKGGAANGGEIRRAAGRADLLLPENAGYDVVWGPFVVKVSGEQPGIENWYHTADFQQLAALRRLWQQAGYLPDTPLTPEQVIEGYQAGQYVVEVGRQVWPNDGLSQAERYGYTWIEKGLSPAFLSTSDVMASMTGVNAKIAGEPERVRRVMLFLEWLHTDAEIYNLLAYGIEGQHWQWRDRVKLTITLAPGSRYQPDFVTQLGNRALSYTTDEQAVGMRAAAIATANATAFAAVPVSPALGFRFDPRPVAAEAAAVRGMMVELEDPIANGQAENINRAVSKLENALEEAGLEIVQTELETQYEHYRLLMYRLP